MAMMNGAEAEVLIVEDETGLANLFATWVGRNHTVKVAHDCATAYELVDASIDVAMLDRQLPDGDGCEILSHIRDAGYDCQVAMVTALDPGFDIIEMGFDDYVCKPATREELQQTVDRLLAHGMYRESVSELYALSSKKALLETTHSTATLEASEEYMELESRIKELNAELNEVAGAFSERQYRAEVTRLGSQGMSD